MWDIKPQGYENVTAEQAKLSGKAPSVKSHQMNPTWVRFIGISVYSIEASPSSLPLKENISIRTDIEILASPAP